MVELFRYRESDNEVFNAIVEGVAHSTNHVRNNTNNTESYRALQKNINASLGKYISSGTKFEEVYKKEGLELFKNPNFNTNRAVRENFDAVTLQIINPVIPSGISSRFTNEFAEIHHIGWGDTARFVTSSNELFQVNEIAEGIRRGVLQPIFNDEVTVNVKTYEVATYVDWYQVAAGVFDWGLWGYRFARSFEAHTMLQVIRAMTAATAFLGAAYVQNGFNEDDWITLVERVSAANGGAGVIALGTLSALHKVVPPQVGLQYGLGEEMAKIGYLNRYLGATLVPIDNFIMPGTINSTANLVMPNNVIYFIAADIYKPVKIVVEGDSIILTDNPEFTKDRTYGLSAKVKMGVSAIVGSKYGVMNLV